MMDDNSRTGAEDMRWAGVIAGVLTILIGALWMLQGLNFVGGSRMTGDPFWARVGFAVVALGVFLVYRGIRQARGPSGQ